LTRHIFQSSNELYSRVSVPVPVPSSQQIKLQRVPVPVQNVSSLHIRLQGIPMQNVSSLHIRLQGVAVQNVSSLRIRLQGVQKPVQNDITRHFGTTGNQSPPLSCRLLANMAAISEPNKPPDGAGACPPPLDSTPPDPSPPPAAAPAAAAMGTFGSTTLPGPAFSTTCTFLSLAPP
jgi:hypothetical protein